MGTTDLKRECIEPSCGKSFVIEAGEAQWFQERDSQLPKRCKPCRQRRRAEREAEQLND